MVLDPLWQQAFATALPSTREGGTAAFSFHAGSKAMLAFTRALRWLISAFHFAAVKWTGKVETAPPLSITTLWGSTINGGGAQKRVPPKAARKPKLPLDRFSMINPW